MSKENMSKVDSAWLHMDDPTNLMMINGFFQFDGTLDYARVRATLEHRWLRFRRFRQRVVESRLPWRPSAWEDDPHFDIDAHLHRIALPAPGDDAALKEVVNFLASTPLDFSKPLWQFQIIENYKGGSLLFARLHHCIADGIALMQVMLSLCDEEADAPWPVAPQAPARRKGGGLGSLVRPVGTAIAATRQIVNESVDLLTHPGNVLELGKEAASYAAALGRVTLLSPDPKTALKGSLGVSKHAAWTDVLPLEEVKALGQTLGGTVNDVLVTLVTGGLRRYLLGRGDNVDGLDVRAMMPVNLRAPNEAIKLGNHFGLVVPALPVGIADPLERFLTVKLRMDQLKNSPEAFVTFAILQTMGWAPIGVEDVGVWFFASKTSLVLTNVPGPRQKLYLAGQRIENLMFWVPQSGRMGVGVSILSYAGGVTIGVITDAGLAPDPETIVAGIHEEFAALKQQVGQVAASAYKGPVILGNGDEHGRCHATTQEGEPCKNRAMAGSAFCHVHARIVADSEDLQRL